MVIILEFSYSNLAAPWENGIFNSPYRVDNDNRTLSLSEQMWPALIAGMNFCRIVCSNGSSNSLISGMAQMKYVSLLLKPRSVNKIRQFTFETQTNAGYADCSSVSAIFDKTCSWLFKLVTSSLIWSPWCRMPSHVKLTLVFRKTTFAFY